MAVVLRRKVASRKTPTGPEMSAPMVWGSGRCCNTEVLRRNGFRDNFPTWGSREAPNGSKDEPSQQLRTPIHEFVAA